MEEKKNNLYFFVTDNYENNLVFNYISEEKFDENYLYEDDNVQYDINQKNKYKKLLNIILKKNNSNKTELFKSFICWKNISKENTIKPY